MKVTWYLPSYHEVQIGRVFGGDIIATFRTAGIGGTITQRPYLVIQDTKKYYNLCRIDYEPGEFAQEELKTLANNYKHLAEIKLDNIRNRYASTL